MASLKTSPQPYIDNKQARNIYRCLLKNDYVDCEVSELQYTATIGAQKAIINKHKIDRGDSFDGRKLLPGLGNIVPRR